MKVYLGILSPLLIGVGVTGDVAAGVAILANQLLQGLTLHAAAFLIWIVGLISLGAPTRGRSDRFTLAIVLGALLFPGLGTFGYTFGSGLAYFLGRYGQRAVNSQEERSPSSDLFMEIRATVSAPSRSLVEIETQPLVEVLSKPDFEAKRAALDLICREPGAQALSLVRALLADPDSDVRSLAALAISGLETHFSERLRAVLARQQSQPEAAQNHAAAGCLYNEYAQAESIGSASRRFYLTQTRNAFEKAISLDASPSGYLLSLAEVLTDLGEEQQAADVVGKAIAANPKDSAGYLLGMRIAFQQQRFDEVILLAERACQMLAENDETLPSMKWWSHCSP